MFIQEQDTGHYTNIVLIKYLGGHFMVPFTQDYYVQLNEMAYHGSSIKKKSGRLTISDSVSPLIPEDNKKMTIMLHFVMKR